MVDEIINLYFGHKGKLSREIPQYEFRDEQYQMAEAVMEALRTESNLIVEAGTGVGKSLAYLVPLLHSVETGGIERAVVSTYTKTLQRQLVEKDLPLLTERLFPDISYALCLGSENYLCLRRLNITHNHGLFEVFEENDFVRLLKWAESTESGLYQEITPPHTLWRKVCREPDLCHSRDCRFFNECFYQLARTRERASQVLVVNHHLLFAHISTGWNILPEFETIVFDEAHEIEGVASDYLGVEVSNTGLKHLLDSIISPRGKGLLKRLKESDPMTISELSAIVERLRMQSERFFQTVSDYLSGEKTKRIRRHEPLPFVDILSEHLDALEQSLREVGRGYADEEEGKDLKSLADRCRAHIESLGIILNQELDGYVYWAGSEGRRIMLSATPIDVGDLLRINLFQAIRPVILTSATLSVRGSFSYIQERLGIDETETLILTSPFNYKENVLLYIPSHIPEPRDKEYIDSVTREIEKILNFTGGRTLVLFTSYSMIEQVFDNITVKDLTILKQGDADSYTLIERFKRLDKAVLFGTYTFWQGIDIPGDDLQCVVITKLPFAVPTDPIVEARMESLLAKGTDPFYAYQVPQAVITFRQGFGRLIRTATDRGIIAILDSRILQKPYGKIFLESIPEVRFTTDLKTLTVEISGVSNSYLQR